jgi:hypothetical protein
MPQARIEIAPLAPIRWTSKRTNKNVSAPRRYLTASLGPEFCGPGAMRVCSPNSAESAGSFLACGIAAGIRSYFRSFFHSRLCSNISVRSLSESSICSSTNFTNSGNCSEYDLTEVSTIRPRMAPNHLASARYSSRLSPVMCFMFKIERLQTIDSTRISRAITARRRASVGSFILVVGASYATSFVRQR